jgi:FkbM family methyltransferase
MSETTHRNPLPPNLRLIQAILPHVRPAQFAALLKRAFGVRRVRIDTPRGRFWVDPLNYLGVDLCTRGVYDEGMSQTIAKYLPPGGSFVDAGANEGYFTVVGAKLAGPNGRVIAIEPQHRLLPVIAENLKLNGLGHVKVLNVAISDQAGVAQIHLAPDTNSGSSGIDPHLMLAHPTQEVSTQTLSQLLDSEGLDRVDVVKMDIEGFEYEALLGARKVFEQRRVRVLAVDLHPAILDRRGKDINDIGRLLDDAGYKLTKEFGNTVWSVPR